MGINYERFMEIARKAHAISILETWDQAAFNEYCELFGPMTERAARQMCAFSEAVTCDEVAAGEYFSQHQS